MWLVFFSLKAEFGFALTAFGPHFFACKVFLSSTPQTTLLYNERLV